MKLQILPLAITMMAGPQIMSAIIFVTAERAVRTSAAFVAGVAIAATLGVMVAKGIAALLGNSVTLGDASDSGSTGTAIQLVLVALLMLFALRNWRDRETIQPPKWLGALQTADAMKAFVTGFTLILLFPSDVVVLLTVGMNLEQNGLSVVDALPFIGLTVLIAALPLLGYLLFRRRAEQAMPGVRDWMNSHSWLINIIVCAIFAFLILG